MSSKKVFNFLVCILMCLNVSAINFSFTVATAANTSAGIYKSDGTLVRTLWSGVRYQAGTYTGTWDGVDDEGRLAPDGNYNARVLTNNVAYQWEGVIGNTSDSLTGNTVHHSLNTIHGLVFAANRGYFCRNQSEGMPSQAKFKTSNPQQKLPVLDATGTSQASYFVCTDGINVYWAGNDAFGGGARNFVYATRVSDDAEVNFAAGTPVQVTYGKSYASTIDEINYPQSTISGLAVQKQGNLLFIAHYFYNVIRIYNKKTGALVRNLMIDKPISIAVDGNDDVWVTYSLNGNTKVEKFHASTDGALTSLGIVLPNLIFPVSIAVSPDNTTVAVIDAGNSQQVKGYSNNNGAPLWTMGQPGGYANGPEVTNDKFYFSDVRNIYGNFVAYQSDGSFWVSDPGNGRTQHYSENRLYIDRIMYVPNSYTMSLDANKPNKVYCGYLEFDVDYSKPLAANNGSWTLSKNWGYLIPPEYDNPFNRLKGVTTLNNGRTYTLLRRNSDSKFAVVELPTSGNPRFTGVIIDDLNAQLYPDGSLRSVNGISLGSSSNWLIQQLSGFDGFSNPIWASPQTIASSPAATLNDPLYGGNGTTLRSGEISSSGVLVSFDGGLFPYGSDRWHLGGIRIGTNEWLWKTAISTRKNYSGAFPADGAYDNGNGSQYAGSVAMVAGRNIFWGFHGEFWKGSQTNKWNQVYDDGLFVGQFGVVGGSGTEAPAGMAGNAFSAAVTTDAAGNVYLYHNDESYHSGIHRWKVTGLNTINEVNIPIALRAVHGGLWAQYHNSPNLNNGYITNTNIDPLINFDWTDGTSIASEPHYSVSWKGFIEPPTSGTYTFYTAADNGVKLWVDGKLLVDQWNAPAGENTGQIELEAGKRYGIRMEYHTMPRTIKCKLSWSGAGLAKTIIPSTQLIPADQPDLSSGIDLMEKLTYNKVLPNNAYGWMRSPETEDYTLSYQKWWSVQTNQKSYDSTKSPDVHIQYCQPSGNYAVTRDLGKIYGLVSSWKVSGQINYDGNYENTDGGGCYVEVLDNQDKVITRFYPKIEYGNPSQVSVYGNNQVLAQGTADVLQPLMRQYQPIDITVAENGATFKYGAYPAVTTPILDASANWQAPKTLRVYFFTNGSNYNRIVDLKDFRFKVIADFFVYNQEAKK